MDTQASIEQVAGILVREGLDFDTHDDGTSYRLRSGHDAVFVNFSPWHDGVRIWLCSPALQGIDPGGAGGAVVLTRLNELNRRHQFVKWLYDDGTLLAVHELLGDDLQRSELLNAVFAMMSAVQAVGDELSPSTGGLRYDEWEALDTEVEVEDE